ncbi:hypothetical protein ACFSTH_09915 [Paenibacillus yanchengensis]|uniref:DNA mismatch repair protein n=1 Tax=Paenibacillus yanchengensis TaxID=2035833 RepID=A0ABW4YI40_9BACL
MATFILEKETAITNGLQGLQSVGANNICEVCIASGGSCCNECPFLKDKVGCQQRNISCTAWLCGYLKYLLYELDLLTHWNVFWEQVPGQSYRMDFTPDQFPVELQLQIPELPQYAAYIAKDLQQLVRQRGGALIAFELRERLDRQIDRLDLYEPGSRSYKRVQKNIQKLAEPFSQFQQFVAAERLAKRL